MSKFVLVVALTCLLAGVTALLKMLMRPSRARREDKAVGMELLAAALGLQVNEMASGTFWQERVGALAAIVVVALALAYTMKEHGYQRTNGLDMTAMSGICYSMAGAAALVACYLFNSHLPRIVAAWKALTA
ncbi:hypothetical protein [Streptomyces sp. NPDC005486]|uniref:hypothetical protein n=1 Tax=Streptomyces sp. NPDC005486 TaxID=3155345 RepID=UPI0033B09D16